MRLAFVQAIVCTSLSILPMTAQAGFLDACRKLIGRAGQPTTPPTITPTPEGQAPADPRAKWPHLLEATAVPIRLMTLERTISQTISSLRLQKKYNAHIVEPELKESVRDSMTRAFGDVSDAEIDKVVSDILQNSEKHIASAALEIFASILGGKLEVDQHTGDWVVKSDSDIVGISWLYAHPAAPRVFEFLKKIHHEELEHKQVAVVTIKQKRLSDDGTAAFALMGASETSDEVGFSKSESTAFVLIPDRRVRLEIRIPIYSSGFRHLVSAVNTKVFGAPHLIAIESEAAQKYDPTYLESILVHELRHIWDGEYKNMFRPEVFKETQLAFDAAMAREHRGYLLQGVQHLSPAEQEIAFRALMKRISYLYNDLELLAHHQQIQYLKFRGMPKEEAIALMMQGGQDSPFVVAERGILQDLYVVEDPNHISSDIGRFFDTLVSKLEMTPNQAHLTSLLAMNAMPGPDFRKLSIILKLMDFESPSKGRESLAGMLRQYLMTENGEGLQLQMKLFNNVTGETYDEVFAPVITMFTIQFLIEQNLSPEQLYQLIPKDLPVDIIARRQAIVLALLSKSQKVAGHNEFILKRFRESAKRQPDGNYLIEFPALDINRYKMIEVRPAD